MLKIKITYNLRRLFHLLKPLGDRIVIELVEAEEKTASGIVLTGFCERKTARR